MFKIAQLVNLLWPVKKLMPIVAWLFSLAPELMLVFKQDPFSMQNHRQFFTVFVIITSVYWSIYINARKTLYGKVIINMGIWFCANLDEQSYRQICYMIILNIFGILYRLCSPAKSGIYMNDTTYGRTISISQKLSIMFDLFLENVVEPLIEVWLITKECLQFIEVKTMSLGSYFYNIARSCIKGDFQLCSPARLISKQWLHTIKSRALYFSASFFSDAVRSCVKNDCQFFVISSETLSTTDGFTLDHDESENEYRPATNVDKMFSSIVGGNLAGRSFNIVNSQKDSNVPKRIRRTFHKKKYRMRSYMNPLETIPENTVLRHFY
ncbi:unnamed protein product [Caenorhabditis angaria]|uniref:Uncharacterized protein n=1 Tax=Caenorhabditis angaria TaxID=860376 RepID=A0A9P1J0A5_9PELO|nr:unnamed protein product [Caenorhabditis angaria]